MGMRYQEMEELEQAKVYGVKATELVEQISNNDLIVEIEDFNHNL